MFTDRQSSLGAELRIAHYSGAIARRIGTAAIAAHFGEVIYLICVWITSELDNSFVGDYTYTRFLMLDQGQWVLTKE